MTGNSPLPGGSLLHYTNKKPFIILTQPLVNGNTPLPGGFEACIEVLRMGLGSPRFFMTRYDRPSRNCSSVLFTIVQPPITNDGPTSISYIVSLSP